MKSIKQLLAVFGIAGVVSAATAQTTNIILQTDFDGDAGQGNFSDGYGYVALPARPPARRSRVIPEASWRELGVGGTHQQFNFSKLYAFACRSELDQRVCQLRLCRVGKRHTIRWPDHSHYTDVSNGFIYLER